MRWLFCACVLIACGGGAPSPCAQPQRDLVLVASPDAAAYGESGWLLSGSARDAYALHRDADAWLFEPVANTYGRYGTWMRQIDAAPYRGKRVRVTAAVRTAGATHRVDFWSRAQASDSPADGPGLAGDHQHLDATSDWQTRTMVFDVPNDAASLQYGIGLAGPGKMWMRDAKLEIVGTDVAVTAKPDAWEGETAVGDWVMTGIGAPDYALEAEGDAVRVEAKHITARYVAVMRVLPAADFVGKKIRASFDVRDDGLQSGACVMKVQPVRKLLYGGFLASDMKTLPGTTQGFLPCELGVEVPDGAKWVLFGFTYQGAGKAWVRNAKIEAR